MAKTVRRGPMGRGPIPMGAPEKAKDFKGTLKRLFGEMSVYKISAIIVTIFAIVSTIFSIVGPKILGTATTELYTGIMNKITGNGEINFKRISEIMFILLSLYGLSAIFSYIQGFVMTGMTQEYTFKLRKQISEKIKKLPMNYFDKKTNGSILSIITNDVDTLSQSLNQCATQLITSIVTLIGILIMMLSINVPMTIISLGTLALSVFLISFIVRMSQKYFKDQQEFLSNVNSDVEEMFSGHSIVKAFNAEERMINRFEKDNEDLYKVGWKTQFLSGLMQPIMQFIGNLGYVAVAISGGYFTIKGKITVGDIQSFIQYSRNFTHPVVQIAQVSNMIQSMIASAERIFEFLDAEEEFINENDLVSIDSIIGDVEFRNVNFGYEEGKTVIENFSNKVNAGQKIAIVGPTGAGKTTIVKLLMRFYNTTGGKILIDGIDINNLDRNDLRNAIGMVLQDTWLFNGSIMENLRYGRLDALDEEVIKAAKAARVDSFIGELPDGYNMILNEESDNISQGQKQLITIARAILANPKIMILDEATSSVDTRTEILIQEAMDALMKGRTTFVIAHRLSTIKNADWILVMNHGNIVEQGTHEDLLNKEGFYFSLYNSQFEEVEE